MLVPVVVATTVMAVVGASVYMLDYSLAPDPNRRDVDSCYQQLLAEYPECGEWMDSLRGINALRDTFVVMATGERHHALYIDKVGAKQLWISKGAEHAQAYQAHKEEYIRQLRQFSLVSCAQRQEVRVGEGVERPAPIEGEIVLEKKTYTVSYNQETRCPNWVAWKLTAEHTDGPYKRANFYEEDDVPEPRATLRDYKGSGWSRGHMCPAGDNKWDSEAMAESFSLVNVCPQNARLNSGVWNSIEMDCRKWARKYGEVYVVCGPVYLNKAHEAIGPNEVVVPEAFFKVVLCLKGKPKAIGVVVKNTEGAKKKDLYYNTLDQVERITGYDFFPSLPDDIEKKVEARANIREWR